MTNLPSVREDVRHVVAGPDTDGDFCVLYLDAYGVSDVVIWGTREYCEGEARRMNTEWARKLWPPEKKK